MVIMPSVTMIDGTRTTVTSTPLKKPMSVPMKSVMTTAAGTEKGSRVQVGCLAPAG